MRFTVVLFDLDGTLIDTNHLIVTSFRHVFKEKLVLDVPPEEIYQYFGEPLATTMARFCPDRTRELTEFYRVFNLANHDLLIRQFKGVHEAVLSLKAAGAKLGVVTSKRVELARRGLRVSGLEPFFDTVVGMDDTTRHKPDPEPALLALERLGVKPGPEVLMVGDAKVDILCGRGAGVMTAAVRWTVQDQAALGDSQPHYWLGRPSDLVTLVLGE